MSDIERLAADLSRAAREAPRKVGRVFGSTANQIRDTADQMASERWATRTDTKFTARRERSGDPAGYVFMDGAGGFFQEHGTSRHPPNPVLGPATEVHTGGMEDKIADLLGDI